jgi:hypothetical protein
LSRPAEAAHWVERRDLVAHLADLPQFPGDAPLPEAPGGHVMGATVHAWLGGEPLRRWGDTWLTGGSMSLRFRLPVHVGDPLTLVVEHQPERLTFELRTPAGELVATGDAAPAASTLVGPEPFLDVPRPEPRLAPVPEALAGRALGRLDFAFDADHDLGLVRRLDADDPYRALRVAHPAWLSSGVNSLIAKSVAMTLERWKHAGTAIRSRRPIESAAKIRLLGRVERLFEAGDHRFADVAVLALADGEPSMELISTIVYG